MRKNILYELQFIDSVRFMTSSLSHFVDDLAEDFINLNANLNMIKKIQINTIIVSAVLNEKSLNVKYFHLSVQHS